LGPEWKRSGPFLLPHTADEEVDPISPISVNDFIVAEKLPLAPFSV
jgi:hypothetical protein